MDLQGPGVVSTVSENPRESLAWAALLLLAVASYVVGLGGHYIPSNGDEMVYAHIARVTAQSGHWLPLASELENMRNTKPPLLFWQAMVAGDWGRNWTLAALRAPSLVYTLLVTCAIVATGRLIARRWSTGLQAACVYLAFFCSFRYGRPYLTSAAETFWFGLPMFWLLWLSVKQARAKGDAAPARASGPSGQDTPLFHCLMLHMAMGVVLGLGLAYKSFALVVPAAGAFWVASVLSTHPRSLRTMGVSTVWTAFSSLIAVGIFGLWFVLDPNPQAVWQEFVVAENAGKMSNQQGYWHGALHGGSSMWAQALAYVQNAGLLACVVLGLAVFGLRSAFKNTPRVPVPAHLWVLLAWLGVWLLVFTLPSQRSARYVIPAMPALALLIALYWQRIPRFWFFVTLVFTTLALLFLGRIAWSGPMDVRHTAIDLIAISVVSGGGLVSIAAAVVKPQWTRAATLTASILVFAMFNVAVAPVHGDGGHFMQPVSQTLRNAVIAVPNGFNGQFERYQFLLPGNRFVPYDTEGRAAGKASQAQSQGELLAQLLTSHDAVIWQQTSSDTAVPPCLPDCHMVDVRWDVKGRHAPGEIRLDNLWAVQDWLFRREWLLVRAKP